MKHTRKRIISILAATAVSVCSLPQNAPLTMLRPAVTAHAANKTYFDFEYSVSLDGSSTALAKYHGSDEIVEIPAAFEGLPVTAITIYAFKDCTQLTDITIPNSVTRFGDEVFRGCSALTKVNIPSGISIIPYGTFRDCQKLTQITLPKSVTVLDDFAFYGCTALESIQIPDHVERIGNFTFNECEALSEVTLPDSTVEIGEYAFYGCSQLNEIILPKSIENIEDTAFEDCPNLTIKGYAGSYAESYANEHDIPFESHGDTSAENVAGGNCGENLTWTLDSEGTLTVSGTGGMSDALYTPWFDHMSQITTAVIEDGVTSIGDYAFLGCVNLNDITIPDSVTRIGSDAFNGCTGLTEITIPGSIAEISTNAFNGCTGLMNVEIQEGVTRISSQAFSGCTSLNCVTIPISVTEISERMVFDGCSDLTIYGYPGSFAETYANTYGFPFVSLVEPESLVYDGMQYIAEDDHVIITGYTEDLPAVLEIPAEIDGMPVTGFAQFALAQCGKLKEVTLPDTVTAFGMQTFWGCENLEKVTLPSTLKGLYEASFAQCTALKSVTIPEGCETIGNLVFAGCTSLSEVSIPESVVNFYEPAFTNTPWLAAKQAENPLVAVNGILIDATAASGEVTVPDGVKVINSYAFMDCDAITKITLPESAAKIDGISSAALTDVTILNPECEIKDAEDTITNGYDSDADKMNYKGTIHGYDGSTAQAYAEKYGYSFESLGDAPEDHVIQSGSCGENLTWTLDTAGTLTISGTGAMTEWEFFQDKLSFNIPWYEQRDDIKKVVIEEGVTTIGKDSFNGCNAMKSVSLPVSLTQIGESAFLYCTSLANVTIPDGVTVIESSTFDGCNALSEIIIPDSVTAINTEAFRMCTGLKSIRLPEKLSEISLNCFGGCTELTEITIPQSVTRIGQNAFRNCRSLNTVTIPENVEKIEREAFIYCSGLTDVTVLNDNCAIYDDKDTFGSASVIHGYAGSTAEEFAEKYGRRFEEIDPQAPIASDWAEKSVISKNTGEAELVVRVGDIDACNDENAAADHGYDPFTAKSQYAHGYPWLKDETDPAGTDRIFVGSKWNGDATDGYASNYAEYKNGNDEENAYGDGALSFSMEYDASEIDIENVILQLCIDDFQALSWESNFTVTLNGKDAPFIAELLNHTDQTGPTAYIVSAMIPSGFFEDIASGKLTVVIDETTGVGDGYAIDFARLLINCDEQIFTGTFSGKTEPGATVRLLGTSTTVTASPDGAFTFNAIPGINAVRASKAGFVEKYDSGIVLSSGTEWKPELSLEEGEGSPDIDFSEFAETGKLLKGDYNGDKEITVADAVLLARFAAEDTALTDAQIEEIINHEPDYDGDGLLTIMDVAAILRKLESDQSA